MSTAVLTADVRSEVDHFDALVERNGESWWGHGTAAGVVRLRRRARLVRRQLCAESNASLLEVAAGAGALTTALLGEYPQLRITATDVSSVSIRRLRQRVSEYPNARAEVADATRLPYGDGTFDGVVANSALHHVDVRPALAELFRVLRPGGRLVVFEPNLLNPQVVLEMNVLRGLARARLEYSPTEQTHTRWTYRRLLREVGFQQAQVRPLDFLHPLTPGPLVRLVELAGVCVERIPILREFSGSLLLTATR